MRLLGAWVPHCTLFSWPPSKSNSTFLLRGLWTLSFRHPVCCLVLRVLQTMYDVRTHQGPFVHGWCTFPGSLASLWCFGWACFGPNKGHTASLTHASVRMWGQFASVPVRLPGLLARGRPVLRIVGPKTTPISRSTKASLVMAQRNTLEQHTCCWSVPTLID